MNSRFLRNGIVTLVLVVGTAALLYMLVFQPEKNELIPYSGQIASPGPASFLQLVGEGKVDKVTQRANQLEILRRREAVVGSREVP